MILDKMENRALYTSCHKDFFLAFEILKGAVEDDLPPAKYELGDAEKNVFFTVSVQEYQTKPAEEGKFEGHQNYIDIQYVVSGCEAMEVCDRARANALTEYDEAKDCQFFTAADSKTTLILKAGDYAVFFPDDIHKPGLSPDGKAEFVKKIVVKVKI